MDMAAFGSLIITEGAVAPAVLAAQEPLHSAEVSQQMKWTAEEQEAVDRLFTSESAPASPSPAAALFVTTLGAMTLKDVVLDQRSAVEEDEEETEPRRQRDTERP